MKSGVNPRDGSSKREIALQMVSDLIEKGEITEKQLVSRLDIRNSKSDMVYASAYQVLRDFASDVENIPERGSVGRDFYLANFWKNEPILAGAVYSMVAKMSALKWSVTGKKKMSIDAARVLASAAHNGGEDWGGFISSTAEDFYTTNRGVFWEITTNSQGYLDGIGHIDSLCCELTGNAKRPMIYSSTLTGQTIKFKPNWFLHFASLSSPREIDLGMGFCAVDRALRAAKLLMGLHDYDEEKLSNLPPEGVATVTGMTIDEFEDALTLWRTQRERDKSLTFPQVLWLLGSQPNAAVSVDFTGFSQIPESFDRNDVISQYVSTLALVFGVDAREFWPISSGSLGTASESEIQHLKAKGKGPGEFISNTERQINSQFPEGTDFKFDTQDIEEDATAAAIAKAWIDAYLPLTQLTKSGKKQAPSNPFAEAGAVGGQTSATNKRENNVQGEKEQKINGNPEETGDDDPLISGTDLLRLLADKGVIPDYLVVDNRVTISDNEIHITSKEVHDDDPISIEYNPARGIMEMKRLPPINLYSRSSVVEVPLTGDIPSFPDAILKEDPSRRNIRGNPIPNKEATRGSRITQTTISSELEVWRKNDLLSSFAPTPEEEKKVVEIVNDKQS